MSASKKNRAAFVLLLAVATGFTTVLGAQLHGYGVPLALLAACCCGVWSCAVDLGIAVVKASTTTVHRCTTPGCEFTVRLRHTDAAENRRWQEAAAAHPAHRP